MQSGHVACGAAIHNNDIVDANEVPRSPPGHRALTEYGTDGAQQLTYRTHSHASTYSKWKVLPFFVPNLYCIQYHNALYMQPKSLSVNRFLCSTCMQISAGNMDMERSRLTRDKRANRSQRGLRASKGGLALLSGAAFAASDGAGRSAGRPAIVPLSTVSLFRTPCEARRLAGPIV